MTLHLRQLNAILAYHKLLLGEAAERRTILIVDGHEVDASLMASTDLLAFAYSNEQDASAAWADIRQLPFEKRPLLLSGTVRRLAETIPLKFDVIVWLDADIDEYQRIEDAFELLSADGILIRPEGEAMLSQRAICIDAPLSDDLLAVMEGPVSAVSLASRGERLFSRRFDDSDWQRLRIIFDAYRDADGDKKSREQDLQNMLLTFWSEIVSGDERPDRWPWRGRSSTTPKGRLDGQQWPRISIVVPTYNQGNYIEETLLSIINQGYENLDLIIMDGGSTDATDLVVRRYLPHISHYVSEPDRGQSHAINKGMNIASGDILTWLNSDDMLAEGALHAMAVAFVSSGADLVAGICRTHKDYVYESEHMTACSDGILPLDRILDLDGGWNAGQFFYQPEVFFSRAIWEKAGGMVREDLYYSMDYELWMRFAVENAKIHVIGRPIALFRRHDQQKTHVESRFKAELITVRDSFVKRTGHVPTQNPNGASSRKLSFCFVNDIGFHYGAGIAHLRLAEAIEAAGHKVSAFQLLDRNRQGVLPTSDELVAQIEETDCDIVVLGNVHSANADPSLFEAVFQRWPTLVIMHDFWWLTGRCAYTNGCRMLEEGCDANCPTPREYPRLDPNEINRAWVQKRALLNENPNVVLVANSLWTRDFVDQSSVLPFHDVDQIKLAIDPGYFVPRDKATARMALGLPTDDFIVIMSTSDLNDARKGALPIMRKFAEHKISKLKVIILGHFTESQRDMFGDMCLLPGYVTDQEKLRLYYAASDLLVGGSREETFGQIFAEAAAIGTPSVAYGVTGVTEAVAEGYSGVLAQTESPDDIVRLVLMLKERPQLRQQLHELGPIYFFNEHSVEACYHSFYQVLVRAGLIDRLGVRTNITFKPREFRSKFSEVSALDSVKAGNTWIPGDGVCSREEAHPQHGIPKPFSWLQGPESRIRIKSTQTCDYWIAIECQNILFDDMELEMQVGDGDSHHHTLARSAYGHIDTVYFKTPLKKGWNDLSIRFQKWTSSEADPRKLALILSDILFSRAD